MCWSPLWCYRLISSFFVHVHSISCISYSISSYFFLVIQLLKSCSVLVAERKENNFFKLFSPSDHSYFIFLTLTILFFYFHSLSFLHSLVLHFNLISNVLTRLCYFSYIFLILLLLFLHSFFLSKTTPHTDTCTRLYYCSSWYSSSLFFSSCFFSLHSSSLSSSLSSSSCFFALHSKLLQTPLSS